MRVDFYLLSHDPAPAAITLLARKVREADQKLLVVADDFEMLEAISQALWSATPEAFLAHGIAGEEHDARQPILLSGDLEASNGASFLLLADGHWREPGDAFSRVLYIFGQATIDEARQTWKALQDREGFESKFWKQQGGRWVEGP